MNISIMKTFNYPFPTGAEETQHVKATQPQDTSTTTRLRPLLVARFYPELQPGFGHDDSLGAKDSYASVPALDDSTNLTGDEQISDALYAPNPPSSLGSTHQQQPRQKKSSTNLKKLLNKPKKMMEVSLILHHHGERINTESLPLSTFHPLACPTYATSFHFHSIRHPQCTLLLHASTTSPSLLPHIPGDDGHGGRRDGP